MLDTIATFAASGRSLQRWKIYDLSANIRSYLDRRYEMATIVGRRQVKHVGLEGGRNIERVNMIGWLRHLSRPDANLARIAN